MNLQSLPKQTLLSETERLVKDERRITTTVLWHLYEIERRRLYAELGFGSLFEYCTTQLKYSAGSAQRRIASMRLLREIPEIAPKIDSGELNVSAVAQAQSVFRQAKLENKAFTVEAKKELIEKLENKSHRECERILAAVNPTELKVSKERAVAANRTEIRFEISDALYAKVQSLKAAYAHKLRGSSDFGDLLEILVDQALEAKQSVPALEVKSKRAPTQSGPISQRKTLTWSRYIPKQIRAESLASAQGHCTYVDSTTKRRCSSSYALEFDHIIPLALGGRTEANNIRVLCRAHNQYMAIKAFGLGRMGEYLTPSRASVS